MTWSACALAALVPAALALAGCGTSSSQSQSAANGQSSSLGHPIGSEGTSTRSRSAGAAQANRTATAGSPADSVALPPPPSPRTPRSEAILRVATRFAKAYLQYEIGRDTPPVKRAITETCTPSFARVLLSQPVNIPSAQQHSIAARPAELTRVTYTGPASLGPGPPVQVVLARYHTISHPNAGGQLTIEVTGSAARWRVASLR